MVLKQDIYTMPGWEAQENTRKVCSVFHSTIVIAAT